MKEKKVNAFAWLEDLSWNLQLLLISVKRTSNKTQRVNMKIL